MYKRQTIYLVSGFSIRLCSIFPSQSVPILSAHAVEVAAGILQVLILLVHSACSSSLSCTRTPGPRCTTRVITQNAVQHQYSMRIIPLPARILIKAPASGNGRRVARNTSGRRVARNARRRLVAIRSWGRRPKNAIHAQIYARKTLDKSAF